jgi:hypothetical protein
MHRGRKPDPTARHKAGLALIKAAYSVSAPVDSKEIIAALQKIQKHKGGLNNFTADYEYSFRDACSYDDGYSMFCRKFHNINPVTALLLNPNLLPPPLQREKKKSDFYQTHICSQFQLLLDNGGSFQWSYDLQESSENSKIGPDTPIHKCMMLNRLLQFGYPIQVMELLLHNVLEGTDNDHHHPMLLLSDAHVIFEDVIKIMHENKAPAAIPLVSILLLVFGADPCHFFFFESVPPLPPIQRRRLDKVHRQYLEQVHAKTVAKSMAHNAAMIDAYNDAITTLKKKTIRTMRTTCRDFSVTSLHHIIFDYLNWTH